MSKNNLPYSSCDSGTVRQRIFKLIKPFSIVVFMGTAYFILHKTTGFYLFCPFNKITGLYCPGCGISRMFVNIFDLDFKAAFSSNCLLFVLSPVMAGIGIKYAFRYIRFGKKGISKFDNRLCYAAIVLLIIFAVIRNVFQYDFLIP